jgi:hypothetical protein
MHKILPLTAFAVALVSLSACNNQPQEVTSVAPDPMEKQLQNAAKVELPPAIAASKTLRCGDNSLVFVDFFAGDKQVQLRTEKGGKATMLKAPEAGQPYTAEGGYALKGTPQNVTVTVPGQGEKTCKA